MIKKQAKVAAFITAAFLIFGVVTVQGADGSNSKVLNINEVIEKTKSGDSALSLYNEKIQVAIAATEAAKVPKDGETPYQTEMRQTINPQRRLLEQDSLKWEKNNKEKEAVLNSKQYYYKYLLQDQLIEVQKYKIERLKKVLEDKKLEIKVGTKAETTLIDDQVNLNAAETALQQLENEKKTIRMKLNINMGSNVDSELNLKATDIPYSEFSVSDIKKIADSMSNSYYSLSLKTRELDLDNKEKEVALKYDTGANQLKRAAYPNTDYKSYSENLGDTIINLGYTIEDDKKAINAKVRMDYNNLLSLNNNVLSRKLDCDEAQINLNSEKAKLNVGMSTEGKVDAAEEALKSADCEYKKAKLEYYSSCEGFKNYVEGFI